MAVHLPFDIERFGPAGLYATELFEVYSGILRRKSVQSNRQALSCDITHSFALWELLHHIFSGGAIGEDHQPAGHAVLNLAVQDDVRAHLGLPVIADPLSPGTDA
jgi:hypothetical protein